MSGTKHSRDGRGSHPNSRANLRPGHHPRPAAPKPPEKSPETAPAVVVLDASPVQQVVRVDAVEAARQTVRGAAPVAAEQLVRMATGARRVDPRVQLAAIRTAFEVSGMLPAQSQQPEQSDVTPALLEHLSRALILRRNAAQAEDAAVVPAAE